MLPQHEVERIALGLSNLDALAGAQVFQRFARKPAVAGKIADRVIDVTVRRDVSQPFLLEQPDDFLHLRNIFGRARLEIGFEHAERCVILVHRLNEARGQRLDWLMVLGGALDDFVVDICDVTHVGNIETRGAQPARDHVEYQQEPRVAKVAIVVNCHPADVDTHLAGHDRPEFLFIAGQRVIYLEHGGGMET